MKLITALAAAVLALALSAPPVTATTLEPGWFTPASTADPAPLPWPQPTIEDVFDDHAGWDHWSAVALPHYERLDVFCVRTDMDGIWVCEIYWWVYAGGKWYLLGIWTEYVDTNASGGVEGGVEGDRNPVGQIVESWGLRDVGFTEPRPTGTFDREIYTGKHYDEGTEAIYDEWLTYRFQRDGSGSTLVDTRRQYHPDKPA